MISSLVYPILYMYNITVWTSIINPKFCSEYRSELGSSVERPDVKLGSYVGISEG